jgi:hypothetical protein
MTGLHAPEMGGPLSVAVEDLHLERDHGGLVQNLPEGLEEGPPVVAGGNDALQALDGLGTVVFPSARVGGVVIRNKISDRRSSPYRMGSRREI